MILSCANGATIAALTMLAEQNGVHLQLWTFTQSGVTLAGKDVCRQMRVCVHACRPERQLT